MIVALPSMFDLSQPAQLTAALIPDLVLIVGAMILTLFAAWRPDSPAHQRAVGWGSIVVTIFALFAVIYFLLHGFGAGSGPIPSPSPGPMPPPSTSRSCMRGSWAITTTNWHASR